MRDEIFDQVWAIAKFTEEQLALLNRKGTPRVLMRTIWAIRTLKRIGALDSSQRGVYAITQAGTKYLNMDATGADAALRAAYGDHLKQVERKAAVPKKRLTSGEETVELGDEVDDQAPDQVSDDGDWRIVLLETLKKMPPAAFERLAKRILRESGVQKVDVVGQPGDGGIDGVGLFRVSLVSFPIYFQCKRYVGSVGPGVVRDFRGAMAGRGDKGLLITTGTFTPAARAEATKAGTPPIDLINGDELCDLILKYRVGVKIRTVEKVTVDHAYFAKI